MAEIAELMEYEEGSKEKKRFEVPFLKISPVVFSN